MLSIDIKIRKARLGDVSSILELWNELVTCSRKNFCYTGPLFQYKENSPEIVEKSIKKNIRSKTDIVLIAEINDRVVGFAIAGILNLPRYYVHDQEMHVGDIFIKEGFRAKGIGSDFIKEIEMWAKKKGIFSLGLLCNTNNENARAAYEKMGFSAHHIKMSKTID